MRRLAAAAALGLLLALGMSLPVAAALPISSAKVVIIVGATEGSTSAYRSYADQAYAEAIKYTTHVTKIYSPNATWTKVAAAARGANILLYYGHGNGWPSPYTYDPKYTTKDGFGLNDPAKLSDSVHKYYGEPYVATLGLAPNAVVLLGNLCYASGNSEPGGTAPTVSVARQRIDNFAAGFIKGGARAVIADGHGGLGPYIRGLFTTGQTIVGLWKSVPDFHNHVASFASTRSPGYTAYSDTDSTTAGYYRSLVTKPTLTTTAVTNAVGDTGADPASLVVPGRAVVDEPDTPLLPAPTATDDATLDLPAGTRLKVLAVGAPATTGQPALIQVQGLDDPTITGYVAADHLQPKDSRAPVLIGIDTGSARFSPNGDGRSDSQPIDALFSESVAWTLEVRAHDGTVVETQTGSGAEMDATWDGLVGGNPVGDGTYAWTVRGTDAWQNGTATGTGSVVVDTTAPTISALSPTADTISTFSPNGDAVGDTVATTVTTSEAGSLAVRVTDGADATVRSWTASAVAGANAISWDGKRTDGTVAPDGDYQVSFTPRDAAGNDGSAASRQVRVVTVLGFVASSVKLIYPQDGDTLATHTNLSFRLSRPATVTWTIRNAAGVVVFTHLDGVALPAGTQTWGFFGKLPSGAMLPVGSYLSTVTATDGTWTYAQSAGFEMDAFAITTSTATPKRGSSVTVSVTSAEPLSTSVRLYVIQPGLATYGLTMTKVGSTTYRLSVKLKTGGSTGTMKLKVWARDSKGLSQATYKALTIH